MSAHHDRSSGSTAAASGRYASFDARAGPDARADLLSDVLRCVRLAGSMLFLVDASTPWRVHAPRAREFPAAAMPGAQHLVSYHVLIAGACWAGLAGEAPVPLEAGDIFVVPHGHAYFLAQPADTPSRYSTADAVEFFDRMASGELPPVVVHGGGGSETSHFICSFLGCDLHPFNPVLGALPAMVLLRGAARAGERMSPLVDFALRELREHRPGSRGVLLRLSELMFIELIRRYVETVPDLRDGWLAGLRDPVVARALAQLHGDPARNWTLAALGARIGASRSVLAERFCGIVGEPPMRYLTRWRMQLATTMLSDGPAKVGAVAQAVGYESEAAFSRAFRKIAGTTPGDWRERNRASVHGLVVHTATPPTREASGRA